MKIKQVLLFPVLVGFSFITQAQYEVGHISESFFDSSRDRDVPVEIYYPSDIAGDDVAVSSGEFPVLAFGHGFLMNYDAYQNIWEFLVPLGYIIVFPTTEVIAFPSHEDFGLDLEFCINQMIAEDEAETSAFFNHLNGREALIGHSMGGGCSWLAAADNGVVETVVGLAPAETGPSAIAAASNVGIPALVLSGSADGVTPPEDHHIPIYDATSSDCKLFVNYVEGSHCYFANEGSLCDLGEFFPGSMSREVQQQFTHQILQFWLGLYLKNQGDAGDALLGFLDEEGQLEYETNCVLNDVTESSTNNMIHVYPAESSQGLMLELSGTNSNHAHVSVFNTSGQILLNQTVTIVPIGLNRILLPLKDMSGSVLLVRVKTDDASISKRVLMK